MRISIDMKADAMYIKLKNGKFAKNKIIDEDTIPLEQLSKFNISVLIQKK